MRLIGAVYKTSGKTAFEGTELNQTTILMCGKERPISLLVIPLYQLTACSNT
ncbi:MAG: hypothetical protein OEZ21_04930 [Candidatus Bathyarchaeota archaeon]|nr:hypothetical protein [Candidatus Bathyarchaeota archaeon]MDH5746285.1 hypothetical protein [Candidatus Bathyarchaeota archaeon]